MDLSNEKSLLRVTNDIKIKPFHHRTSVLLQIVGLEMDLV
jgi:hypothetical protein